VLRSLDGDGDGDWIEWEGNVVAFPTVAACLRAPCGPTAYRPTIRGLWCGFWLLPLRVRVQLQSRAPSLALSAHAPGWCLRLSSNSLHPHLQNVLLSKGERLVKYCKRGGRPIVLLQAHLHPPDGWLPRALGQKGGGGGPFAGGWRG
jgi:hypothetical protein